jgi:hypothetical protein
MEWHRKIGEMIFSTLNSTSLTTEKLQVSLNNVQSQLKLEKISSLAKDNKIKSIEDLVLKIVYDPSNFNVAEVFALGKFPRGSQQKKSTKVTLSNHF